MAKELLTDPKARKAKPLDKPYRLFDGDGLALWISPTGAKSWQLRYRLGDKEQTATLGKYPRIGLAEARKKADELRKRADAGEHLTVVKRAEKQERKRAAANTFGSLADDWVAREARRQQWSDGHRAQVEASIRNHLGELLARPIKGVTAPTVAPVLAAVERSAPLMYEKVRPRLHAILDYAVELGALPGNPLPAVRRGRKVARRHFPAVTDPAELGAILRAARAADPCKGIARAHSLLAFTAMRVSEVVGAKWPEFDLTAGNWSIPRERMKRKDAERGPHVVPLPPALLAQLREWKAADGDGAELVCPTPRDPRKPVTPEGCEKFYRDVLGLAGKHSPHSWRAAFSTVCRDAGKAGDTVEAQLDHVVGNKVAAAYDRAARLELRRELVAWYEGVLIAARDS